MSWWNKTKTQLRAVTAELTQANIEIAVLEEFREKHNGQMREAAGSLKEARDKIGRLQQERAQLQDSSSRYKTLHEHAVAEFGRVGEVLAPAHVKDMPFDFLCHYCKGIVPEGGHRCSEMPEQAEPVDGPVKVDRNWQAPDGRVDPRSHDTCTVGAVMAIAMDLSDHIDTLHAKVRELEAKS